MKHHTQELSRILLVLKNIFGRSKKFAFYSMLNKDEYYFDGILKRQPSSALHWFQHTRHFPGCSIPFCFDDSGRRLIIHNGIVNFHPSDQVAIWMIG